MDSRLRVPLAFLISEAILGGIVGRIFDKAFSTHAPDYTTVLELDSELQTMENAMPPALRAPSPNDRLRHPRIDALHRTFMAIIYKIRAMLHRPFLLKPYPAAGEDDKFAYSRRITIERASVHFPLLSHIEWDAQSLDSKSTSFARTLRTFLIISKSALDRPLYLER